MTRSRRHARHGSTSLLMLLLPRVMMVSVLSLLVYYLLHKTHQHLGKR